VKRVTLHNLIDQAESHNQMTRQERELAKWFLDKEWDQAKEYDNFTNYHHSMGWIFCNAFNLEKKSVLDLAFKALEVIKKKRPKAYYNFMVQCKSDLEKIEPIKDPDKIVSLTTAMMEK